MPLTPQEELELKQLEAREARQRGAQMSPFAQGALTAAQGATFNFADEMAGLINPQYRDVVRGATQPPCQAQARRHDCGHCLATPNDLGHAQCP